MQFRKVANRVQLIRYCEYSAETKKGKLKMVASIAVSGNDLRVSDGETLTEEELGEIEKYKADYHADAMARNERVALSALKYSLDRATAGLLSGQNTEIATQEWAHELYASIDALTKVMRKKGLKRPPVVKKAKPKKAK